MSRINRVEQKLQYLYFKGKLLINSVLGLPAQTRKEIEIFKTIFNNIIDNKKIKVFEWGSGFSTIYYAEYLKRRGADFEWDSIDNNKIWHKKVKLMLKNKNLEQNIYLHLKEFLPFWEKPGWGATPPPCGKFCPKSDNEKAYTEFPKVLNGKFDIVIIDARFRRHCIKTAKKVLAPGGVVIMHDAHKLHYHVGLDDYRFSMFRQSGKWYPLQEKSNMLWIGSNEDSKAIHEVKKFAGNVGFKK